MADPIRVAVAGHRGKVGSLLAAALQADPGIEYVGGVGTGDDLAAFLKKTRPQALVDFTRPSVALHNALAAVAAGAAPVVGTSGIPADGIDKLEVACKEKGLGGIVAPNFAIGAVLMMYLAEIAAPHFDAAEIVEMHHAAKLDAPSGTALATAKRLAARRGDKPFAHKKVEKETLAGTRGGEEGNIAVHSIRLPGFVADQEGGKRAIDWIKGLTDEVEVGKIYQGKVVRIMPFGAFVEVLPNQDGLVHISKLTDHRVERVEEVANVGDEIVVKAVEVDSQGRLNLSRQAAIEELTSKGLPIEEKIDKEAMAVALASPPPPPREGGFSGGNRGGRNGGGGGRNRR